MKNRLIIALALIAIITAAAWSQGPPVALGVIKSLVYVDHDVTSAPGNPDPGSGRVYIDNTTFQLSCVLNDGTSCLRVPVSGQYNDADRKSDVDPGTFFFTVPPGGSGSYFASCYEDVISTAATYALPSPIFTFTSPDSASIRTLEGPANAVSLDAATYSAFFSAAENTNVEISSTNYVSIPGNTMHYAIHCKITYLGP